MSSPVSIFRNGSAMVLKFDDGTETRFSPTGYGYWISEGVVPQSGGGGGGGGGETSNEFRFPFPRDLHTSYEGHSGVDWPGGSVGNSAPIRSIGPGVVDGVWDTNFNTTGSGNGTGEPQWRGRCVRVNHGNIGGETIYSLYAHMSVISVSNGQTVTGGQQLGVIGNTGFSFGTHLHFEVNIDGRRRPTDSVPSGYTVTMQWMDAHAGGSW